MARLRHAALLLLLGAFRIHCSGSVAGAISFYGGAGASASGALRAGDSRAQDVEELAMASAISDPSAVSESSQFSEGVSGRGRSLLQGCRKKNKGVKKKCFKKLPQCPRCRFLRGFKGYCKKPALKKIFKCIPRTQSFGSATGSDSVARFRFVFTGTRIRVGKEDDDYEDLYAYYVYDDTVPSSSIYESDYVYESDGPEEYASVQTPKEFQAALEAGVRHIVLTAHLDMRKSPSPPDIKGIEALDKAIGRVKASTVSILGRCDGRAPSSFKLKEELPPGACGVRVKEDFLDIPLGSGSQGGGLLLDSLYVAVASPAGKGSSVLLLHVDGQVWITNSVFQGAGRNGRAIDVSTADGGSPELYVQATVFTGFTRDLAPGIRVTKGATAMLDAVAFRNMEVLQKRKGTVIEASAIAAYPSATLSLVGVEFEKNVVYGEPAGDRAVAIAPGRKGSAVYAEPRIRVWQWPGGPTTQTKSKSATASFLKKEVAPVTAALRTAEKEQKEAEDRLLGRR